MASYDAKIYELQDIRSELQAQIVLFCSFIEHLDASIDALK